MFDVLKKKEEKKRCKIVVNVNIGKGTLKIRKHHLTNMRLLLMPDIYFEIKKK